MPASDPPEPFCVLLASPFRGLCQSAHPQEDQGHPVDELGSESLASCPTLCRLLATAAPPGMLELLSLQTSRSALTPIKVPMCGHCPSARLSSLGTPHATIPCWASVALPCSQPPHLQSRLVYASCRIISNMCLADCIQLPFIPSFVSLKNTDDLHQHPGCGLGSLINDPLRHTYFCIYFLPPPLLPPPAGPPKVCGRRYGSHHAHLSSSAHLI